MSLLVQFVKDLLSFPSYLEAPNKEATIIWAIFVGFLTICYYVVPGKKEKGVELADGSRLEYPINGFSSFILLIGVFYLGPLLGWWSATVLYDNFWPLFTVSNIFSFSLSLFLYIKGFYFLSPEKQKQEHRTGSFLQDFFYGPELNPRVLGLDLKYFAYRPLIMGWALLILSFAHAQYAQYGTVSLPMAMYVCFTWWYTVDYLWLEQKICTTWDVIAENFGWQLAWGDYTFFPFFYSIQAHFLMEPKELSWPVAALIVAVFFTGYTIFRQANNQKDSFKRYRGKAKIWGKTVKTTKDGRLLMSGWWGVGRHINYLGDIMISVGWTLPCGFGSLIPWSHSMFFIPFLMHREHRDEKRMSAKYGATYEEYCAQVRYRIFPFIY